MSIYLRKKSWYYDFVHKGQRYTGSFGAVSRTVAKEELARKKAEVFGDRPPSNGRSYSHNREQSLEKAFVAYLKQQGVSAKRQVQCSAGIADIVTPDAIYEVKTCLHHSSFLKAVGQVLLYRQHINPAAQAVVLAESMRGDFSDVARAVGVEVLIWKCQSTT